MKNYKIHLLLVFFTINQGCNTVIEQHIPVADKIKKELLHHGHTRIDNYYWMNESENPKVLALTQTENEYLNYVLKPTEKLQEKLCKEMSGRIQQTDVTVPYKDNGYYYYIRYDEGKEYPIYARKKELENADEEILLNVNEMAIGYSYFHISNFGLSISPNNKLMAVGYNTENGDTIIFKDLSTGKWLEDKIPNTTGDPAWANDNKTVFYSIPDTLYRSYKVKRHTLGENPEKDQIIFHEKDARFDIDVFKSKSKKYIIIRSLSTSSIEHLILNADYPYENFKVFQSREEGLEYFIKHFGDKFYILTNDNASNFRIMVAPANNTEKENWKEVVPHKPDVLIYDFEVFKNHLALRELKNGLTQINIIDLKNLKSHYIPFEEEVYSAHITMLKGRFSTHYDFDSELLKFEYSSLTTPHTIYEYNMRTGEKKILKQQVSDGYDPTTYESKRLYAVTKDNKKVPISLVYKKELAINGENPLLLTAYGAYGSFENVGFNSDRISLLDRGFVFAIAHVRGGAELGREWYEDGMLLNKKNTFTDFIACAEHLIKEGYTNPKKLFAQGGSMGGMLMGAVVNMRPELFKGIIANVPFMDVTTSLFDESFEYEYDELGNPNKKEYFDYVLSYSPYDNIKAKNYPAMLLPTGFNDVLWDDAAKFIAKLRELKTDTNPVLLYTNMNAGHEGASGRFEAIKETAMEYAFLLQLLEINE